MHGCRQQFSELATNALPLKKLRNCCCTLLWIHRTNIAAFASLLLFKHPECDAGSSRRHAAVNGRRDCDQGVEFVVGGPDAAGLFNPVSSADHSRAAPKVAIHRLYSAALAIRVQVPLTPA